MKIKLSLLTLSIMITGCQSNHTDMSSMPELADDYGNKAFHQGYSPASHKVTLASYAEQMVVSLFQNGGIPANGSIAVASFVDFDDSLRNTNVLGNQLAENLIIQLQKFGYNVSETKATKVLQIDDSGDYILSRDPRKVKTANNFCCILTGTMIYAPSGIEVNARLFNTRNNMIIASSHTTIPYFVTKHLGIVQ